MTWNEMKEEAECLIKEGKGDEKVTYFFDPEGGEETVIVPVREDFEVYNVVDGAIVCMEPKNE